MPFAEKLGADRAGGKQGSGCRHGAICAKTPGCLAGEELQASYEAPALPLPKSPSATASTSPRDNLFNKLGHVGQITLAPARAVPAIHRLAQTLETIHEIVRPDRLDLLSVFQREPGEAPVSRLLDALE